MTSTAEGRRPVHLAAVWGVAGVIALLVQAIARLTPVALEPIRGGALSAWQIGLYGGWVLWMAYSEGYRGFHKQFAPRVVARAAYLARHPRPAWVLLAPVFCMGLFHATRKRLIISWALLIGIVTLIIIVRQFAQPYRGIVDGGVVVGLVLGLMSLGWFCSRAIAGQPLASPEVPEGGAGR